MFLGHLYWRVDILRDSGSSTSGTEPQTYKNGSRRRYAEAGMANESPDLGMFSLCRTRKFACGCWDIEDCPIYWSFGRKMNSSSSAVVWRKWMVFASGWCPLPNCKGYGTVYGTTWVGVRALASKFPGYESNWQFVGHFERRIKKKSRSDAEYYFILV